MKSVYAPLPFSYLSPDGGNPRVGLRKEGGVYGTSADVPRLYDPETRSRDPAAETGLKGHQYGGVYANTNDLSNVYYEPRYDSLATTLPNKRDPAGQQMPLSRAQQDVSPRSQAESPYVLQDKKPAADYEYPPRERGLPRAFVEKEIANGYGVREPPERPISPLNRVTSQLPSGRQLYEESIDSRETARNGRESPPFRAKDMASNGFDNFILMKDPLKSEPATAQELPASSSSSSSKDPSKSRLETLFESKEPAQHLPRPKITMQSPHPTTNGDHNPVPSSTKPSQETGFDGPSYSLYYGMPKAEGATGLKEDRQTQRLPDSYGDSNAHLVKDSEQSKSCCGCNKCTAVVIAVILTAILCLGAGFIAGWYGGIASREGNSNADGLLTVATSQSDSTTVEHHQMTSKVIASVTTTKAPVISTTTIHLVTSKAMKTST